MRSVSLNSASSMFSGRCWVLGSGPSLDMVDLSKLAGEHVIACNASILCVYESCAGAIWHFHDGRALREVGPRLERWQPWTIATRSDHLAKVNAAFGMRPGVMIRYARDDLVHARTCMETALQIAQALGFSRAYLVGVDLRTWDGEVYAKKLRWKKCWFRDEHAPEVEPAAFQTMFQALSALKPSLSIRVYDCSPISTKEVFDHAVYDDVLDASAGKRRVVI